MAQFSVNTQRFDPYKNFKFRIKWDGKYVAGVSKVGALKRTTEEVTHREGGDPSTVRKSPGQTSHDDITLERGITYDPEFENWANLVFHTDGDAAISLKNYRKDILLEVLNLQGTIVKAYKLYNCWVSEYQALPELDASANEIAFETITLKCEGWERDLAVTEQEET